MPEVNYAPDPRPQPPTTAQSRNFGTDVYEGKAPAPPANRRKAAVSYTAAGVLSVWDVISGQWVSAGAASSGVSAASFPGILSGVDDVAIEAFDDYSVGAITSFTGGSGWGANGVAASGCSIVSRTMVDGRTHNRLAISNGSYGRRMPWGAFWNRLKVVMLVRINSGVDIPTADGYFGVCSGTTNMADSATCTNYVGLRVFDGSIAATFATGTKANSIQVNGFRAASRRVALTTDRGGLSSGHVVSASEGYLSVIVFEISRPVFALDSTSVNYSVAECSCNLTSVEFSRTKEACYRTITDGAVNASLCNGVEDLTQTQQSGVTCTPFAFDQSTGVFDTINFNWQETAPFEIAAFAVRKLF